MSSRCPIAEKKENVGILTRILADLLRQSVYSRLAGYEDLNDAERLSQDSTFRLIGSRKIWERGDRDFDGNAARAGVRL